MGDERFDVLVIGAGPAGSVAALVLARAGARVALVDKATFPRDKACGDLVGPRGVQVLDDLGLDIAGGEGTGATNGPSPASPPETPPELGDMLVVGPNGRRVRLPSAPGLTYPGHALAIPRVRLDAALRASAVEAGAFPVTGRAGDPFWERGRLRGFELPGGRRLSAEFVVGADGATSKVADSARLVDPRRVLWGFAIRCYLDQPVELPTIVMWEPVPHRALRGYGWIFPGPDGRANVGLGVGTLSDRRKGTEPAKLLPRFLEHLSGLGLVDKSSPAATGRLGGWLKMGMVGTTAAAPGVLLVGDAAGLVNPLQGEGIAHAMTSARAAAEAIIAGPADAPHRYSRYLADAHLPYHRIAATAHAALLSRPRVVSAACRALTVPSVGARLAEGWAVFWNELLDGAPAGRARRWAEAATAVGRGATAFGTTARWFDRTFGY